MTITERISEDLKEAMRAGEKLRLETLRMLRAALLELEKSGKAFTADDELRTLQNQAKRRKDAIEQYRLAQREDLAAREADELGIIETYLPQQLNDDEIRDQVRAIITETGASGPTDFKVVMPKAMAAMRGRADGARVQAMVREELQAKG